MIPDHQTNPLHYKDSYHHHGVTYQSTHQNRSCVSADNKVHQLIRCIVLYIWMVPMKEKVTLTHFRPMFDLCRNQVVGFYSQNVYKTPVEE